MYVPIKHQFFSWGGEGIDTFLMFHKHDDCRNDKKSELKPSKVVHRSRSEC